MRATTLQENGSTLVAPCGQEWSQVLRNTQDFVLNWWSLLDLNRNFFFTLGHLKLTHKTGPFSFENEDLSTESKVLSKVKIYSVEFRAIHKSSSTCGSTFFRFAQVCSGLVAA